MNLIYRAQQLEYTPAPTKLASIPCAVNWRYQIPGFLYEHIPALQRTTLQPRAVNWRYQLP